MPVNLFLPLASLYAFLAVLARVSAALALLPLPGFRQAPLTVRIILALSVTLVLAPAWPAASSPSSAGELLVWIALDAALGLWYGLLISFFAEAFQLAAQTIGLQAGFAYASIVDPNTQADSGVLLILANLGAGLLLFALGLHHHAIGAIARSLERFPPGSWIPRQLAWETVCRLGAEMFETGVRLALPVLALLTLAELFLALLGRLHAQLQLLTLSFPLKLLAALLALAALAPLYPRLLTALGASIAAALRQASSP